MFKKKIKEEPDNNLEAIVNDELVLEDKKGKKNKNKSKYTGTSNRKKLIIEINKVNTVISEISFIGSKLTVHKTLTIKNPSNTWNNGAIALDSNLSKLIIDAIREAKIKTKDTVILCNSDKVLVREIDEFALQDKDKANIEMIKNVSYDLFPVSLEDYVLAYRVLSVKSNNKDEKVELSLNADLSTIVQSLKSNKKLSATVQVYAAPRNLIDSYKDLAKACKLTLKNIDFAVSGMINIVEHYYGNKNTLLVDIGYNSTYIYTSSNGEIKNQKRIDVGYNTIAKKTNDLSEVFGTDLKSIYKYLNDTELLYEEDAINRVSYEENVDDYTLSEIVSNIREDISTIVEQIETEIGTHDRRVNFATEKINNIIICNNLSEFPDLTDDIKNLTHVDDINYIDLDAILPNKKGSAEISLDNLHAIGSVLNPVILKDEQEQMLRGLQTAKIVVGVIYSIAVIVLGIYIVDVTSKINDANDEIKRLNIRLEEGQNASAIADTLATSNKTIDMLNRFNDICNNASKTAELLVKLEDITPLNTVYNSLVINDTGVTLDVTLSSKDESIKLLTELQNLNIFSTVVTNGITRTDSDTAEEYYNLNINCEFKVMEQGETTNE